MKFPRLVLNTLEECIIYMFSGKSDSNKKTPARITRFTLTYKLHSSFNEKEQSDDLDSVYLQIKHDRKCL